MCLFYFMDNKVFFFQRPSKSGTAWYVRAFRTQFNNVGPLKTFKKLFLFIPFFAFLAHKPRQTNVVRSQVGNVFAFYIRFACTFILITCLSPNVAYIFSIGALTTTTTKKRKKCKEIFVSQMRCNVHKKIFPNLSRFIVHLFPLHFTTFKK